MTGIKEAQQDAPEADFSMSDLWPQTAPLKTLDELIEEHAEELEKNGGDLEAIPAIAALLAFDEAQFQTALERWALKVTALKADSEAVKQERVRIQVRETRWAKAADALKGYIQRQMEARQVPKFKSALVSITVARNSAPTVRALSESTLEELFALGSPFVSQQVTYKIDRDLVLGALKNGEAIPEGLIVETGRHLRIS